MVTSRSRNAVVTGGASGIGRAVALRLARDGAGVAIWDLDEEAARQVAIEASRQGRDAVAIGTDVSDSRRVRVALERTQVELGPVQILVHSAGIAGYALFADMTEAQWDRMIAVHLKGAFNCIHAVVPGMIGAGWGRIVSIASVAALSGGPGVAHYAAAKAGIIGLTKALTHELGPHGITVNVVAPGIIDTPMLRRSGVPDEILQQSVQRNPIRRIGVPDDVAAACAYLISEEAGFCTGQVLSPNGGGRV